MVLKAKATGTPAPKYQWYKNGVVLKGKTSAKLVLKNVKKSNSGRYYCKATSGGVSTKSNVAKLDFPRITTKLAQGKSLKVGKRARLQVKNNFKANNFKAEGLPDGLKIDNTGQISGKPTKKGFFKVTITAKKKSGSKVKYESTVKRTFKVS